MPLWVIRGLVRADRAYLSAVTPMADTLYFGIGFIVRKYNVPVAFEVILLVV